MKRFLILAAFTALWGSSASATSTLKQVQVSNGSQVDLLFDSKISKSQVKTEYFNDIIQVILTDTSVYPAKISSVSGGDLLKIFAYQYAPKLVRCRLTVKGKAESFKDRIQLVANGKILTIRVDGDVASVDKVAMPAAQAVRAKAGPAHDSGQSADESEESALLDRVLRAPAPPTVAPKAAQEQAAAESAKSKANAPTAGASADFSSSDSVTTESHHGSKDGSLPETNAERFTDRNKSVHNMAGGKALPSLFSALWKLALVTGLFCLLAFAAKKWLNSGRDRKSRVLGAIGKFTKTGMARKGKMIEVISTHYLGPKKSIAVVRVAQATLVLGITNESINLITRLSDSAEVDSELEALAAESAPERSERDEDSLFQPDRFSKSPVSGGGKKLSAAAAAIAAYAKPNDNAAGAVSAGPAIFSNMLKSETSKPAPVQFGAGAGAGVRSQIRSKLEGLKPL